MSADLLVVGIDALDPDLLDEWESSLPNLVEIADSGFGVRLESTLPAVTGIAWPTLMTGKNPGKTGVSGFESGGRIVSRDDVQSRGMWELLDDAGRTVCSIGVPLSYPLDDLADGVVISGIRTPSGVDDWISPPELAAELPDPVFDTGHAPKDELLAAVEHREAFSRTLLDRQNWDVFVTVFMESDRGGHSLLSPSGDGSVEGYDDLRDVYEAIDDSLGELRTAANPENVVVVSDHGFGRSPHRWVNMQRWFADQGYIETVEDRPLVSKERVERLLNYLRLGSRLPGPVKHLGRQLLPSKVDTVSPEDQWDDITYEKESNGGGVHVPDDQADVIDDLIAHLQELTDPETGTPIFDRVVARDDVYSGPYSEKFPEILTFPSEEHQPRSTIGSSLVEPIPRNSQDIVVHRFHGVLLAAGDDIATDRGRWVGTGSLTDLTPTVLHLADVPVPSDCDGDVLIDLLAGEAAARPIEDGEPSAESRTAEDIGDADDRVREHLEDLGYL